MTNHSFVAGAGIGALLGLVVMAQLSAAVADDAAPLPLSEVVVVATRTPHALIEIGGTVTLIDAAEIEDKLAVGVADLARYEPSISVPRAGTRFGFSGFSLRGIGGNRVAIEIDGVPVADTFDIGSYSNAGRDLVDLDLVRQIEVLYGPASTLYGSDAIGGVVAYRTHSASELAGDGDPMIAWRSGYRDDDQSLHHALTGAWHRDALGVVASISRRAGEQRDASARGATPEDWQEWDSLALFGKLDWQVQDSWRLTASADRFERDADTVVRSLLGTGRFRSTTLLIGDDRQQRDRYSLTLGYDNGPALLGDGELLVYRQQARTRQFSLEERESVDLRRRRWFDFEQRASGLEFSARKRLDGGGVEHLFGYGFELTRTFSTESRDGWQTTLAGAAATNIMLGESFPVRDFPLSRTIDAGLYAHDEIRLGRATLIPALRFDYYDLDPRPDAVYREDNPATRVVGLSEHNLSPKLGLTWSLTPSATLFAQYARGFRAPPFEDANIGLNIPLFNIRALPNPDLRSETSDALEAGFKRRDAHGALSLSAHYTRYDDFIESKARIGIDPADGTLLFQSRNLERARIWGAQLRWERRLGSWSAMLDSLQLSVAAAWTRGEDDSSGAPLNDIDPARVAVALDWQSARRPLRLGVAWRVATAKTRTDDPDGVLARAAGYGVADLTASYIYRHAAGPALELRAGLFNIFDKTYWHWSAVRGLDRDDPTLGLLSEPGRSGGVSLKLKW